MVIGCYRLDGLELAGWSSLDAARTERGRTGEVMDSSGESTGWNRALFSLAPTQLCPSTPAIGAVPGQCGSGLQFSGQASPPGRGWWMVGTAGSQGRVEPRNWPALTFSVGLHGRGPWILVEVHFLGNVDRPSRASEQTTRGPSGAFHQFRAESESQFRESGLEAPNRDKPMTTGPLFFSLSGRQARNDSPHPTDAR